METPAILRQRDGALLGIYSDRTIVVVPDGRCHRTNKRPRRSGAVAICCQLLLATKRQAEGNAAEQQRERGGFWDSRRLDRLSSPSTNSVWINRDRPRSHGKPR